MTHHPAPSPPDPPECSQAFDRLPWLVNGSLPVQQARELEAHVTRCRRCLERLAVERELFAAVRRPVGNVQQSPLVAWNRFEAALAAAPATGEAAGPSLNPAPGPALAPTPAATGSRRRHPLRLALTLQAAAIALLSIALLWVLAARSPVEPPAAYRTVAASDATVGASGPAWRVVPGPATSPAEVDALLAAQGLTVLAGPSADGVYTVVPLAGIEPRIDALRADRRVRLVESIGPPANAAAQDGR